MSTSKRMKQLADLDRLLKDAADAIHEAFEAKRAPSKCAKVRELLDKANELRVELGLVEYIPTRVP